MIFDLGFRCEKETKNRKSLGLDIKIIVQDLILEDLLDKRSSNTYSTTSKSKVGQRGRFRPTLEGCSGSGVAL